MDNVIPIFLFNSQGDRGVGKTSILFKYITEMYGKTYIPTCGVDYRRTIIETHNNNRVALKLWDTRKKYS